MLTNQPFPNAAYYTELEEARKLNTIKSRRKAARFLFFVFMLIQFISLTRVFYIETFNLNSGWNDIFSGLAITSVGLLYLVLKQYERTGCNWKYYAPRYLAVWVKIILFLIVGFTLLGLVRGNALPYIAIDEGVYLILILGISLGVLPFFWQDMDKILIFFVGAGVILNLITFPQIYSNLTQSTATARLGVLTLAYDIKAGMSMWPFLLLTSRSRSRGLILFIFAVAIFDLLQQILFQKRFPLVMILIYLFIFLFVQPIFLRTRRKFNNKNLFSLIAMIIVFVSVSIIIPRVVPVWVLEGQWSGLQQRFSDDAYGGNLLHEATIANERYHEVNYMLRHLNLADYILGRGFGGYFIINSDYPLPYENSWLPEANNFGRREIHIGALMPLLKGGIILSGAYFFIMIAALLQWKKNLAIPFRNGAYVIVVLEVLQLSQGGAFILTQSYHLVMLAISLGICFSTANITPIRK